MLISFARAFRFRCLDFYHLWNDVLFKTSHRHFLDKIKLKPFSSKRTMAWKRPEASWCAYIASFALIPSRQEWIQSSDWKFRDHLLKKYIFDSVFKYFDLEAKQRSRRVRRLSHHAESEFLVTAHLDQPCLPPLHCWWISLGHACSKTMAFHRLDTTCRRVGRLRVPIGIL